MKYDDDDDFIAPDKVGWVGEEVGEGLILRLIQRYFLFVLLIENIYCDYILEPSQRDSSNQVTTYVLLRNMENYPKLSGLPLYRLLKICSCFLPVS